MSRYIAAELQVKYLPLKARVRLSEQFNKE